MLARFARTALFCIACGCASPADMAKSELGDGKCADQAEQKCEEDLASSDRLACLKREIYLCEELEKTPRP
jgi:hypothetical protein